MRTPNETTVAQILSIKEADYTTRVQALKKQARLFKNEGLSASYYLGEIKQYEEFLVYLKQLKKIIKTHKLSPQSKVTIAFIPSIKKIKTDKLKMSKLGGVPSCFFRDLASSLKDKAKAMEILKQIYPKDASNHSYLKYVGDIDSSGPTYFMNEVLEEITYYPYGPKKPESIGYFYKKETSRHFKPTSALGSFFIDQNFGQGDLKPNGLFKSLIYTWNRNISATDQKAYIKIVKEFMEKEVDTQENYSVDQQELREITTWKATLEIRDEDSDEGSFVEHIGSIPFKIFGSPRSQQTIMPWYSVNGWFNGPRLLTPFITLFSRQHDNIIQVYADVLHLNSAQETSETYLKVDISST